tara:strand:- start:192 stop:1112 length:921 start_codon:yes stop_codon:yes gene_type:complete
MRILLVVNKTLRNQTSEWIDGGYWNVYLPLKELGHDVYFYDTVRGIEEPFSDIIDTFKPELIFCCMTGNRYMTPFEPWPAIEKETQKGNCRTFNWFCDDTWRFDNFSSQVCKYFHVCSTPEKRYVEKFRSIGYNNIIVGQWHVNSSLLPSRTKSKKYDASFCGQLLGERATAIEYLKENGVNIKKFHGLEYEDMLKGLSESRIGINFSKNYNGIPPKTQMKLRMFEVPAANSLLFTEYHDEIEDYFQIDKEVVCFQSPLEMLEKMKALLKNKAIIEKISENGHKRFMKDHRSTVRLQKLLDNIMKI